MFSGQELVYVAQVHLIVLQGKLIKTNKLLFQYLNFFL